MQGWSTIQEFMAQNTKIKQYCRIAFGEDDKNVFYIPLNNKGAPYTTGIVGLNKKITVLTAEENKQKHKATSGKIIFTIDGKEYPFEHKELSNGCYISQLNNNLVHGSGVFTLKNGDIYTGEFKNGLKEGEGTLKYANGNVYVGKWKNDKFEGQGMLECQNIYVDVRKNRDIYTGEFKNGLKEGEGTLKYANGAVYTGEFKNDKFEGKGVATKKNGETYDEVWENGKVITSTLRSNNQEQQTGAKPQQSLNSSKQLG